jgi:hypothetical protein
MTATLTGPRTYEVVESDPAWDAIVADCEANGAVVIKRKDGVPFQLLPAGNGTRQRPLVTSVPDFAARRAKTGDTKLEASTEAEFYRLLRGE